MVQLARLDGAGRIMMSGHRKERLELAKKLGANDVVDATKESMWDYVEELTDGRGAAITIDAVGTQSTVRDALELAAPEGQRWYSVDVAKVVIRR